MKHLRKSVEVCMSRIEALASAYSAAGDTYYDPGYPTHSAYFPPSDLSHSDDPQCSSASCTPATTGNHSPTDTPYMESCWSNHPLPLNKKLKNSELPQGLKEVVEVLSESQYLIGLGCPSTVAQQLARFAVFGEDIMKKCTPLGSHTLRALPQAGLWRIKCAIFNE